MSNNTWQQVVTTAVDVRHRLHQNPELGYEEEATAQLIRDQLSALHIPWESCAGTGTLGRLAPDASGRHIALRGDIDALPIYETTELPYASCHDGRMHACGHDGHTATLLASAAWLKQHEEQLPGPVTLLFQPAEEGKHGAKRMIADGALRGIDAIFGWHNWPAIPYGKAVCPDGPVMSANGIFYITVEGQGGHASQPEACRDPILAGAAIVTALQQVVSRRLPPQHAMVVSVASFDGISAAPTVIPDRVRLSGSVRCANTTVRDTMAAIIKEVVAATATAHACTAQTDFQPTYGATVNHPDEAELMRQALAAELGDEWQDQQIPVPIMGSEDFSYYLQEIPGAFALIGADDGQGHHLPCHNAGYDFNDSLIAVVTRIYARIVGAPLP